MYKYIFVEPQHIALKQPVRMLTTYLWTYLAKVNAMLYLNEQIKFFCHLEAVYTDMFYFLKLTLYNFPEIFPFCQTSTLPDLKAIQALKTSCHASLTQSHKTYFRLVYYVSLTFSVYQLFEN